MLNIDTLSFTDFDETTTTAVMEVHHWSASHGSLNKDNIG